jgi:hypothetical protein
MTPHRTLLAAAVLAAFTPAQAQDAAPVADSVATAVSSALRITEPSQLSQASRWHRQASSSIHWTENPGE